MASHKIDLYRTHKTEYVAPKSPVLLKVGPARYLTIRGAGTPGGTAFTAAIGALYAVAFTIKMTRKMAGRQDYAITKFEAIWPGDMNKTPRRQWAWTLMIRTPGFVTAAELKRTVKSLLDKGKPVDVKRVRLRTMREGRAVQMLHVGPYDREAPTWSAMRRFAERQGLKKTGVPHEIYLSDPRRVPPSRLMTILRQPVR